nr:uncharacterized protein LOC123755370 isoform X3 [Procambarus clarkii]
MKGSLPHPQLILLLLVSAAAAVGQLASALQVCHIPESVATLKAPGTVFFRTDAQTLQITMTAPSCGVSTMYSVNMTEVTTGRVAFHEANKHRHWHEMSLINCGKVFVKIGFKLIHLKLKYTNKPNICDLNEIEFSFDRSTVLGRGCKEGKLALSQDLCLSVIYAPSVEVALGPNRHPDLGSLTFPSLDHKDDFGVFTLPKLDRQPDLGGLALEPFQTKTDLDKLFSGLNDDNFAFATYSPPPSYEDDIDYSTRDNDYRYINFSG